MHLIYRRYSRSGYAPSVFYIVMALGFAALAVFALVRADWLIAGIAAAMVAATAVGARVMRRLSQASAESSERTQILEDSDGR